MQEVQRVKVWRLSTWRKIAIRESTKDTLPVLIKPGRDPQDSPLRTATPSSTEFTELFL